MLESSRLKDLTDAPERPACAYVLYWMQQSQRVRHNPALEAAVGIANRLGLPLLVCFGLTDGFPEANARHYAFMLQGLAGIGPALQARGIAFTARHGSPERVALELAEGAAALVVDAGYLRIQKQWRAALAAAPCRVLQVEGDVVVPLAAASAKTEIGARSLRPKIMRVRDDYLVPLDETAVEHKAGRLDVPPSAQHPELELSDPMALLARLRLDRSAGPVRRFTGGEDAAAEALQDFLNGPLAQYGERRNRPSEWQVSFMSPYLHFGQISPVAVALAARGAEAPSADRASYLEELVVRRELSMNFVDSRAEDYDRYDCIPAWAQATLEAHKHDARPAVYDRAQLLAAETHDPYWNAAMREMRETGYMHNHMRMYWGKKILEWTPEPREAYETALSLNNTLFLDGRDANSFSNIAWVFGMHDRPWPAQPVFGNVRSMMVSGLKRKTDPEAYVAGVADLVEAEA